MTPQQFVAKWKPVALTERAAAHSHFLDLCALLGHDDPVKADPKGEWFAFEKGATKTGGGEGFADVWKKGFFAWEYKKKKRDLNVAMEQLVRYAAALENPPLQVVCDTNRFVIRTAWTNAVPTTYEITLDDLADPKKLDILRSVFFEPEKLRPTETRAGVTKQAADKFSEIAGRLGAHASPEKIAHFINQLVFCFFANSVKLLPDGFFLKLLDRAAQKPERAQALFNQLFAAMETGGEFDLTDIAWFNGGLFDGRRALLLDAGDIVLLQAAATFDWSQIDPSIFGSLFERFLDPEKRAQTGVDHTGVHYTDAVKIMMIVEPVILRPLRAEWALAKAEIEGLLQGKIKPPMRAKIRSRMSPKEAAEEVRSRFLERLLRVRILDPACGSGNFLYLALQGVKDLENLVNLECEALGLLPRAPMVGPEIVHGIEINQLAAELARTTIWIGDIQWRRRNGIYSEPPPILRKLDSIECRDALVTKKGDGSYEETVWPEAEFIVGNPPFLGTKKMLSKLGEIYTSGIRAVYADRLSGFSDLVCWWFEKAKGQIASGKTRRVGLVATNKIRNGKNRKVLEDALRVAPIFEAWGDEEWVVDGAAVRVSLVCFGIGDDQPRLEGRTVAAITSSLGVEVVNLEDVEKLAENANVAFIGVQLNGQFDISGDLARAWLLEPANPNDKRNSDVIRPLVSGQDITRERRDRWVIDFGNTLSEKDAALFEKPFGWVKEKVKPDRDGLNRKSRKKYWWRFGEPMPKMRQATAAKSRYLATSLSAKHRNFIWIEHPSLVDSNCVVIAKDDDAIFGILHSRFHLAWARRQGNWLGAGNDSRYTPTTTFETFPFPEGLTPNIAAQDYASDSRAIAVAKAAKNLDNLRTAWLNPSDLIRTEPEVVPTAAERAAGAEPIYPDRILPIDGAAEATLRKRTLTNLYNQRPPWLVDAHHVLDVAVASAYGWPADISDEDALAKLLELNLSRAAVVKAGQAEDVVDDLLTEED